MNAYQVTLSHDSGTVRITTWASSLDAAIKMVLKAEGAPPSAVKGAEALTEAQAKKARM